MNKGRKITIWFIGIVFAVIVIFDIWILNTYGGDATISRVILTWSKSEVFKYAFISGVSFLMGHLLWTQKPKCPKCDNL